MISLCLFQQFPFFHLFPSTPCRMHYLNRKVCVRNDSPIERRANTRQPASQPATQPSCLEYLHSESYKRSKKASRFRVGVSRRGKRLGNIPGYFVLLRLLENRQIYSIYE